MGGMAGSGQGNPIGNSLIRTGIGFGGRAPAQPTPAPGASFTPVTPNVYTPAFSSNQQAQMPIQAPTQQMMPQMAPQNAGLQALMANMMARYGQVPGATAMQAPRAPMPRYSAPALAYRPNMQPAQASLGRVAKSVILQQKEAAEAELAKMKEAEDQRLAAERNRQQYDSGGGG